MRWRPLADGELTEWRSNTRRYRSLPAYAESMVNGGARV